MPLEPLIYRSRYGKVKKSYKNRRKFGKSEKNNKPLQCQKNKSINRSIWNNKIKKIMAITNWAIISKHKKSGVLCTYELGAKWTYRTAQS